jgi:hypothetical protein
MALCGSKEVPSVSKKQHDFMEAIAHNKAFAKKVHVSQSVGRDFAEADKGKTFKRGGDMATNPKAAAAMAALMGAAAARRRAPRPVAAAPVAAPAPMAPAGAMGAAPGMAHGGLTKSHHKHLAHHHLAMAEHHMHMHKGGHTVASHVPESKDMGEMGLKHGGKAKAKHHYAKGGAIEGPKVTKAAGGKKEARAEEKEMKSGLMGIEHGEKKRAHGEHAIQTKGHTRAMQPKMAGTTTGLKHGGKAKAHHKK